MAKKGPENDLEGAVHQAADSARKRQGEVFKQFDEALSSYDPAKTNELQKLDILKRMQAIHVNTEGAVPAEIINQAEKRITENLSLVAIGLTEVVSDLDTMNLPDVTKAMILNLTKVRLIGLLGLTGTETGKEEVKAEHRFGLSEIAGTGDDLKNANNTLQQLEKYGLLEKDDVTRIGNKGPGPKVLLTEYAAYMLLQTKRLKDEVRAGSEDRVFIKHLTGKIRQRMPARELAGLVLRADKDKIEEQVCILTRSMWPDLDKEICTRKEDLVAGTGEGDTGTKTDIRISRRIIEDVVSGIANGEERWGDMPERRTGWKVLKQKLTDLIGAGNRQEIDRFMKSIPGKIEVSAGAVDETGRVTEVKRRIRD